MLFLMPLIATLSFIEQFSLNISFVITFFIFAYLNLALKIPFFSDEIEPGGVRALLSEEKVKEEEKKKQPEATIDELKPREKPIDSLDDLD